MHTAMEEYVRVSVSRHLVRHVFRLSPDCTAAQYMPPYTSYVELNVYEECKRGLLLKGHVMHQILRLLNCSHICNTDSSFRKGAITNFLNTIT